MSLLRRQGVETRWWAAPRSMRASVVLGPRIALIYLDNISNSNGVFVASANQDTGTLLALTNTQRNISRMYLVLHVRIGKPIYWTLWHKTHDYTLQISTLAFSVTVFTVLLGNGFQQQMCFSLRHHGLAGWRPSHASLLLFCPLRTFSLQVRVKVMLLLMVSQSVCLGVRFTLGLVTRYYFLFDFCCCLCREPSLARGRVCFLVTAPDTRYISSERTAQETPLPAITWRLLSHNLATDVFVKQFLNKECLC
jgi:hypothetical protein